MSAEDFEVGESVLVFYGQLLFGAKILKIDMDREDEKAFFIHYIGWTKRHDTWVPLEVMNKNTADNIKYQEELKTQMVAEKDAKKKKKKKATDAIKKKKKALKSKKKVPIAKKETPKKSTKKTTKKVSSPKPIKKKTPKKADTTKKTTVADKPVTPVKQNSPAPKVTPTFQVRQRMPIPWHWRSDPRFPKEDPKGWTAYTLEETARIEEAFKKKQKSLKLTSDVMIDFIRVVQYHIGSRNDARPIKRGGIPVKGKKRKYVMYANTS